MNLSEIDVSICCLVYNHEKYLRQCLDGFMMQKGVSFEVLIHDDASTDHSADIIREYEKKYPNIIKPIYQTENQYSKGVKISVTFQYPRAKGKYIAICEGDDFWTDPLKLKKQVYALEENSDCHCCIARVQGVKENGRKKCGKYPYVHLHGGILDFHEFYTVMDQVAFPFQLSGFMIRTDDLLRYSTDLPDYARNAPVGDFPLFLYAGTLGPVYYFSKPMSCYRRGVPNSWTNRKHRYAGNIWMDMIIDFEKSIDHKFYFATKHGLNACAKVKAQDGEKASYQFMIDHRKEYRFPIKYVIKAWAQLRFNTIWKLLYEKNK